MKHLLLVVVVCVLIAGINLYGQVPQKMSYQGLLTTSLGTPVPDGSYSIQFDIYNLPSGGTLRHTETHSTVALVRGAFSVLLGPLPAIFTESLYVEVTALSGPGILVPTTFSPRSELASAPYSLAPWSTNGSSISYMGGNVGIGTTTPSRKLDVAGSAEVDDTLFTSNVSSNSPLRLQTGGTTRMHIDDATGNVGIGTTSPNEQLEITGNLRLPVTSATTGLIKIGADRFMHSYGTDNTFIGLNAGNLSMSGGYNTAGGTQALSANTTGLGNTANGFQALSSNTEGNYNTAVGMWALTYNTTGLANTACGNMALRVNGSGTGNTAVGNWALVSNAAGDNNTASGMEVLVQNTTGSHNTAHGYRSLISNTTGSSNTAHGAGALYTNVVGSNATALGYGAMYYANNTSTPFTNYNVAVGYEALRGSTTASANTGNNNTALGYQTLWSNTTGEGNTANGYASLYYNITGDSNTAVGNRALFNNSTGDQNTAIGRHALITNTSGSNNTAIGFNANVGANNLTNATAIGATATVNASNKVRIGNGAVTVIEGQVAWSFPSDVRLKKEIKDSDLGLDFVNKLHPVSFKMKTGDEGINYGFIAQEVEAALEGKKANMVLTADDKEQMKTMRYTELIAPLVKAIQEQQKQIDELKAIVESLSNGEVTHNQ